jgi:hypothetical protein
VAEFDARWRRLASVARRAQEVARAPSQARIAELARLAHVADERAFDVRTRASRRSERLVLVAVAASLLVAWILWAPDADAWRRFERRSTAVVAALPDRVPRAPRTLSPRTALRVVPDVGGFFRSFFLAEGSR